jgi:hypothetical protein
MIVHLGLNIVGILKLPRTFLVIHEFIVDISIFQASRLVSSFVCRLRCARYVFIAKNGD